MSKNNILKMALLFFIVLDLGYSFAQYYNQPFGGDLVPLILPSKHNATVLENPFGQKAILKKAKYAGANRFFAHKSLELFFKNVPLWLQSFLSPISSLYASAALSKLIVHIALVCLLSIYVLRHFDFWRVDFLTIFLLISPFFQTHGYFHNIGIIDGSVTYLFFYGLPIALLLLFFLPSYLSFWGEEQKGFTIKTSLLLGLLMICLPFSGPLIAPLGLMICSLIFFGIAIRGLPSTRVGVWKKTFVENRRSLPKDIWWFLTPFFLLCLYSYYLSQFNIDNQPLVSYTSSLRNSFSALRFIFTEKLAMPLILLLLSVNFYFLKKKGHLEHPIWRFAFWVWIFLFAYLAILPWGGFRDYRPKTIRHDTFIPVTLGFIFTIGLSSKMVFNYFQKKKTKAYLSFVALILILFSIADNPGFDANDCEREALEQLSASQEKEVVLSAKCTILSWKVIEDYNNSDMICALLKHWNIVDKDVRFVQRNPK